MSGGLNNTLTEYENQLKAVDEALKHASGEQEVELLDLKYKLLEVISLLKRDEVNAISGESSKDDTNPNQSMDDEFAKFQMEIEALGGNSSNDGDGKIGEGSASSIKDSSDEDGGDSKSDLDQELMTIISSLEGNKCRAPFKQTSGEFGYYNALIISADYNPETMKSLEDIEVKVMFCNPVCDEMKPCSFFLDGHCKFSDEKCRYSHGQRVSFPDLQEFILPDLRNLKIDSKCLAKCADGLWKKATVDKCLEHQMYSVKFDKSGHTDTVEAQFILPIDQESADQEDSDNDSWSSSDENSDQLTKTEVPDVNSFISPSSCPAVWEKHTSGIGSKLMEKMGHVWGQGLGKNSDGIVEPVEAVILPAGKSLDKCIEMREGGDQKGPISLETRLALEQDKEEQRAKKVKTDLQNSKKETVFDFLNSRISTVKDEYDNSVTEKNISGEEKPLNIQIFSVGEDIKRVKRELSRLHQSLQRNSNRNEAMRAQVQKKITAQNDVLQNLQAKEIKLNKDMKSQNSQKKLTVF